MGIQADLLSRKDTAAMLKVTIRCLHNFVKRGLLKQVGKGRQVYFHRADVVALLETMGGNLDLASVATTAMRALIKAEQCEKVLNKLLSTLGFTSLPLVTTQAGIFRLHERAKGLLAEKEGSAEAGTIFHFAQELFGISEEYLRLVEHHTADGEPWRVYLEASEQLCKLAPRHRLVHDYELASAYGFLEAARRHIRAVAYAYVRATHGASVADEAFIGDNAFDPVITTLFPN
jgi:hypothetical protein